MLTEHIEFLSVSEDANKSTGPRLLCPEGESFLLNYDTLLTATRTALGIVALLMNGIVTCTIFQSANLRRKTFYFLCAKMALCDALVGFCFMVVSSVRLVLAQRRRDTFCTLLASFPTLSREMLKRKIGFSKAQCLWITFPTSLALLLSNLFNLVTAVDRFLAVVRPLKYRAFRQRPLGYLVVLCSVAWLFAAVDTLILGVTLVNRAEETVNLCIISEIYAPIYVAWSDVTQFLLVIAALAISIVSLMRIRAKVLRPTSENSNNSQDAAAQNRQQRTTSTAGDEVRASTITIVTVAALTTVTQLSVRCALLFGNNWFYDVYTKSQFTEWVRLVLVIGSCLNFPVYISRMPQFRREVKTFCAKLWPFTMLKLFSVSPESGRLSDDPGQRSTSLSDVPQQPPARSKPVLEDNKMTPTK